MDDSTATFSRVLLTGLGGQPEAPPQPPVRFGAPPSGARGTWARAVATTRRLAGRIGAVRGDERTAMLVVGAVVGVVLLLIAVFVLVVRLSDRERAAPAAPGPVAASDPTPAPTATVQPTPTGSPLPPSGGSFTARHSSLCLAAPDGRTDSGAQLVQRACGVDLGSSFLLVAKPDGTGSYELVDAASSKCVDVYGGSGDDGAPVVQWDCNGGGNQTFQLREVGAGWVQVVAVHSGKCLDVTSGSRDEGALIQQYGCRDAVTENDPGAGNQSWRFSPG